MAAVLPPVLSAPGSEPMQLVSSRMQALIDMEPPVSTPHADEPAHTLILTSAAPTVFNLADGIDEYMFTAVVHGFNPREVPWTDMRVLQRAHDRTVLGLPTLRVCYSPSILSRVDIMPDNSLRMYIRVSHLRLSKLHGGIPMCLMFRYGLSCAFTHNFYVWNITREIRLYRPEDDDTTGVMSSDHYAMMCMRNAIYPRVQYL